MTQGYQTSPPPFSAGTAAAAPRFIALDGGLNLKEDPIIVQSPQVTTAQNIWTMTPGQIRSLPIVQQGNYSSAATYPIYGLYEHIPTDPYTTGDVLVHTEVAGTPSILSGAGFPPSGTIPQNALTPGYVKTKAFGPPQLMYSNVNSSAQPITPIAPGPFMSPIVCMSATLPYGLMIIPTFSSSAENQSRFGIVAIDQTGNAIVPGALQLGYGAQYGYLSADIIENPSTPGQFFVVAQTSATSLQTQIYNVVNGVPTLVSQYSTAITTGTGTGRFQLVTFNGHPYVVYIGNGTGTNIYAKRLDTLAVTTLVTTTATSPVAAWVDNSNTTLYVAFSTGSTNVSLVAFNSSLTAGSVVTVPNVTNRATGGSFFTGYCTNGVGTIWFIDQVSLGASLLTGTLSAVVSQPYTASGTAISLGANGSELIIANPAGLILASKGFPYGHSQGGVVVRSGSFDLGAPSNSYAQPTYFVLDSQLRVVARFSEGSAPSDSSLVSSTSITYTWQGQLPSAFNVLSYNSSTLSAFDVPVWQNIVEGFNQGPYTIVALNTSINSSGQQVSTGPGNAPITTLQLGGIGPPNVIYNAPAVVTFGIAAALGNANAVGAGKSQVIPGWLTSLYDSQYVVEAGWHETPHWLSMYSTGTGSNNPAGTYLYRAIYRWVDSSGQVHRSAPSPVLSVSQASTWNAADIIVFPPMFTARNIANLSVELYRTDNAGTVFYLVATQSLPYCLNSTYATFNPNPQLIMDSSPTTASANFGVAYPGYWQNTPQSTPPPSFVWQVMSQGRHFGLAQVAGSYRVYYTNIWTPGVTVEWNANGYLQVPPELGDCRSITAQDSNVFVLGTQGIGVFNGNGPAQALGTDGQNYNINDPSFSTIVPIPNAAGCVGTGCPVQTPTGILYQSSQGFLLIGRDLSSQFAGQLVDALTGVYGQTQTVYGQGILLPKLQMILFTNPGGDSLLYDYNLSRWTLWPAAIAGPISGAIQRRDGTIFLAQQLVSGSTLPQTFTLNGSSVNCGVSALYQPSVTPLASTTGYTAPQIEIETPWLFTGQTPGGEGEFWEAGILGSYYAPHQLKVEMAFNYQGYGIYSGDTQTFNVTAAPYPAYQFRVRPPGTARCWAVRFRITVLPPSGFSYSTPTPDFARITGIMMFSATQQGNTRLGPGVSR